MRIKRYTWSYRNDFYAIYSCEHCGYEQEGDGYDDDNFHNNVIPNIACPNCGKIGSGETKEEVEKRNGYLAYICWKG